MRFKKLTNSVSSLLISTILFSCSPAPLINPDGLIALTENVFVIPDNFVRLVPNIGIIVGSEATLIVDTGLGPANGKTVQDAVNSVSENETLYVVTTHYHPEHSLGVDGLSNDAVFIASEAQLQEMLNGEQIKNNFASRSSTNRELIGDSSYPVPDETFQTSMELNLGDISVELNSVGPLHTKGDLIIHVKDESVLFSGDIVMGEIIPSVDAENGSFEQWSETLEYLDQLDADIIVGSHGSVGGPDLIDTWQDLIIDIVSSLEESINNGDSESRSVQLVMDSLTNKYPTWRNDDRRIRNALTVVQRRLSSGH